MSSSAQNYRIKSLSERRKIYSRWVKNSRQSGSGCGSVGKAVASDTRVRGLNPVIGEVLLDIVNCQLFWKDENKEKEAENGPFFFKKKQFIGLFIGCGQMVSMLAYYSDVLTLKPAEF